MTEAIAERTLTVNWDDPAELAAGGRELSGIEFLGAIASGELPPPPIARLLGFDLVEVDEGRAVFSGTPGEQHYNPIGVVHAGLVSTLLDSAMGCSVHSLQPAGGGYTTLELKVNLVRAVTSGTGPVRCEAQVVHAGRRVATAEGEVRDADGRLYAHATTTCMVFPPPA